MAKNSHKRVKFSGTGEAPAKSRVQMQEKLMYTLIMKNKQQIKKETSHAFHKNIFPGSVKQRLCNLV